MKEQAVLDYLAAHPDFLLTHGEALGVAPLVGNVRSFASAQWAAQQQKAMKLSQQMALMVDDAAANQQTMRRLLAYLKGLLAANTLRQVVLAVEEGLVNEFALPAVRVVLLRAPEKNVRLPENALLLPSHPAFAALAKQQKAYCGNKLSRAILTLLPNEARGLESFLLLPLIWQGKVLAAIIAGDGDETRFTPDLPLDWMVQMADATAVALARCGGWK